jgi:hypothetical protein
LKKYPHCGYTLWSTLTFGHSVDPVHKDTFVVGSVMQPVPVGVPVSAPLSPVKGMVVVPASVLDEGITQPEREDELEASRPPKYTTLAAESRRVLMATPPSTRMRAQNKFFAILRRRPYGAPGTPSKGTEDDGLLHPAPRTVRS